MQLIPGPSYITHIPHGSQNPQGELFQVKETGKPHTVKKHNSAQHFSEFQFAQKEKKCQMF